MRAFQFRLQTLQRIREQLRDAAQRQLAEAEQRRTELQQCEQDVRGELQGLETHMRKAISKPAVDVDRVMDGHRHQISLQARLAELDQAIAKANEEVAQCRHKLVEADRDVKVLEKLHERQLEAHTKQLAAHEAKLLDEAAAIRASRQAKTA